MKQLKAFFLLLVVSFSSFANEVNVKVLYQLEINSTINPATYRYLEKTFKKADSKNALILITMNTPGGLVSTTKDILGLFGKSKNPVAIWIYPEGSSATSAGALISSGSHFLFMSPGTNIGAATPVQITGDIKGEKGKTGEKQKGGDLRSKAINDLVALTKSLSDARGRNGEAFAEMISKAKSFTTQEAIKQNIINAEANQVNDIVNFINGKTINIQGAEKTIKITPESLHTVTVEQSFGDSLLNTFSHPQMAYLLFLIGAALIYFELQAPGGFIAGSLGVLFLILAGMGFQVLPINFGAIGLILASFILFIIEMYVTSYGVLSLGGIAALVFGSLLLFETQDSLIALDKGFIISTVAGIIAFMGLVAYTFIHYRKDESLDFFGPLNETGTVHQHIEKNVYRIKVKGSFWKAISDEKLQEGDQIKVLEKDNQHLTLKIKKV